MNFNNVNACAHALGQKCFFFFKKLAISQKLADGEKSGESITINFNNVNAFMHVLEQKVFFGKLAIYQKLEEISKCCQKDFLSK